MGDASWFDTLDAQERSADFLLLNGLIDLFLAFQLLINFLGVSWITNKLDYHAFTPSVFSYWKYYEESRPKAPYQYSAPFRASIFKK